MQIQKVSEILFAFFLFSGSLTSIWMEIRVVYLKVQFAIFGFSKLKFREIS